MNSVPFLRLSSAILLMGAIVAFSPHASADPIDLTLDYSNTVGAYINFDGHSHFSFFGTSNNFKITTSGVSAGLLGEITGTYTIGTVTTVGIMSSAAVTGAGTLVIHDGAGHDLAGSLVWQDIMQIGTGDFLNTSGSLNLSNITYSGLNSDLLTLASGSHSATDVLSFQFGSSKKLATLKTTAAKTSYSGEVYAVRTPETVSTLLLSFAGIAMLAWFRRKRC
ncbi:MAG TPA: hypothetical protein VHE61_24215 [Opitutaceae bacterium]|nr:hypothetical protein [Opitutaceae bacterium]